MYIVGYVKDDVIGPLKSFDDFDSAVDCVSKMVFNQTGICTGLDFWTGRTEVKIYGFLFFLGELD